MCGPHCQKPLTKTIQSKGHYNTDYRFGICVESLHDVWSKTLYSKAKTIWTVCLIDQDPGDLERGISQTQRLQFPIPST